MRKKGFIFKLLKREFGQSQKQQPQKRGREFQIPFFSTRDFTHDRDFQQNPNSFCCYEGFCLGVFGAFFVGGGVWFFSTSNLGFLGISGLVAGLDQNFTHFIPFPRTTARLREPETLQAQSQAPKFPGILIITKQIYGNGGRAGPQGFGLSLEKLKWFKQVQPKGTSSSFGAWVRLLCVGKWAKFSFFPPFICGNLIP